MEELSNSSTPPPTETKKSKYCRLCASKCDQVIKVFGDKGKTLKLVELIKKYLQIKLSPCDSLPKTVCTKCNDRIQEFSSYHKSCSQSQISLRIIFSYEVVDDNSDSGEEVVEDKAQDEHARSENRLVSTSREVPQTETEENDGDSGDPGVEKKKRKRKAPQNVSFTYIEDDDLFDEEEPSKDLLDVWKCTVCDEELPNLESLRSHHLETHNQAADFKCNKCNKVYSQYRSYSRHVKLHIVPKRYGCDVCGKRFSQKTVLQSHSTVHSEERPHVCPQCGKAFKQFSSLYLHSRCHLPEQAKPKFACSHCDKRLSSKHTLDTHLKIHYGEKNFVCEVCGKRFHAKGSLNYHMMSHDSIKSHSCLVCGKGFKTASLLSKHSALHTGVKPHQCDVCGKQFRERSALKEHDRIHTGEMPYSCEICGKNFRFKGILTVHRRIHTGERPYTCSECRRSFTNWANYNKHMKRRHKNNESPPELIDTTSAVIVTTNSTHIANAEEPPVEIDLGDNSLADPTTMMAVTVENLPAVFTHEALGVDALLKTLPCDMFGLHSELSVSDVGSYITVVQTEIIGEDTRTQVPHD